jgi:hypothetical protein
VNTNSVLALPLVAPIGIASFVAAANQPVGSTFSTGADGWSVLDLKCDNYAQSVGGGKCT